MMSSLQAAMSRERDKVDKEGMRESLESGLFSRLAGWKGVFGDRVAMGKKKELNTEGMDFVR
jgi:hypothetical protein